MAISEPIALYTWSQGPQCMVAQMQSRCGSVEGWVIYKAVGGFSEIVLMYGVEILVCGRHAMQVEQVGCKSWGYFWGWQATPNNCSPVWNEIDAPNMGSKGPGGVLSSGVGGWLDPPKYLAPSVLISERMNGPSRYEWIPLLHRESVELWNICASVVGPPHWRLTVVHHLAVSSAS